LEDGWSAGGSAKGGFHYGETDEIGFKAAANRVHVRDLHATILALVGLDHQGLSYRFNGPDQRLSGFEDPRVVTDIIA
jgi:Protein of unknown function (DUF1501)